MEYRFGKLNEQLRLFQNFSFGTATLDLSGKAGLRPLFLKPVPKLTEFWNSLK
jgi:hypothetical protein